MGIENGEKRLGCITKSATQDANPFNRAMTFAFKTADDELILGVPHYLSDVDLSRLAL